MLKAFGPGIWLADGPTVTAAAGFHYPTRMAVIRLSSGGLLIWSPTALTDELAAEVAALGPVHHLVPPNALHHTFLREWHHAYPEAEILAPPGLRERRSDIPFTGDLSEAPVAGWKDDIDHVLVRNAIATEIVFFHQPSASAIFTDLLQHFPPGWFRGWRAIIARLDLMTEPEPSVPRKFRMGFTDRTAARDAVRRILAWPTEKVVMAHGEPVAADGKALLQRAFHWLAR